MQAVFDQRLTGATVARSPEFRLNISVVYTSESATVAALKTAAALASRLGGRISLVVPEVVSYHLPLNNPPVQREWSEKHFCTLAAQSGADTTVRFYLCRDREEMLARELKPHSLVVIGGKQRWWPTSECRLARKLRRLGHEVILAETE